MPHLIKNATLVTPTKIVENASLVIDAGKIADIWIGKKQTGKEQSTHDTLDARGRLVLPGFVDLHGDAIEKFHEPRAGVAISDRLTFVEIDRHLASSGITTTFHAIGQLESNLRSLAKARRLCDLLIEQRAAGLVRHELHLRCELPQATSVAATLDYLARGIPKLVSLMDHTPGQGKYQDLAWFRRLYAERSDVSEEQLLLEYAEARKNSSRADISQVESIYQACAGLGVTLLSHDDDTAARVDAFHAFGVTISEFPINAEAAQRAKELGMSVVMGAPNVMRGGSHGNSIAAAEAIQLGLVDILCSDYYPPSMLQALFKLVDDKLLDLPAAVAMMSSTPALAAGLRDRGSIDVGKLADLIIVGEQAGLPVVTQTIVGGRVMMSLGED